MSSFTIKEHGGRWAILQDGVRYACASTHEEATTWLQENTREFVCIHLQNGNVLQVDITLNRAEGYLELDCGGAADTIDFIERCVAGGCYFMLHGGEVAKIEGAQAPQAYVYKRVRA